MLYSERYESTEVDRKILQHVPSGPFGQPSVMLTKWLKYHLLLKNNVLYEIYSKKRTCQNTYCTLLVSLEY